MRTCPKCGRANQPTRKYCIRCGGNLISVEKKPKTISAPVETPATPEPEVTAAPPPVSSTSEARVTTNDEWVKPSSVSKDRVRAAEGTTKPKSEMEKAMEAFAKADKVGIEEEGEGIIETRMLRASEVQELMGEMETQRAAAQPPSTTPPAAAPATPPPSAPPPTAPPSPPPAQPKPEATVVPPITPPPAAVPSTPQPAPKPTTPPPMPKVAAKAPAPAPPPDRPPSSIPEIASILSTLPDPDYRQDPQIIGIVNDLKNLHTELAQFNSDLDTVRTRLESEVQDYWNVAEVKRIHFESLEEQLRLAKQEWNDSTKVYQQAEKRMKNEIASREKRIKDIRKRIEKAEEGIGKRVKDLDKEKEKQA